jgi:predicted DCC family thiol-disulfide oxidoreductase YuxK
MRRSLDDAENGANLIKSTDGTRFLLVLVGVSVLWVAFAKLVVPPLIESAYRGESLSVFNRFIQGQHVNALDHYFVKWDWIAIRVLLTLLASGLLALLITSLDFLRKYVGEATPGSLGAVRMWTCLILLITLSWENLGSIALVPVEMRHPAGVMRFLHFLPIGYERFLASQSSLSTFQLLTELLLFLGVIGWRTRIVIPLAALCGFLMVGILVQHSFFWHQNLIPLYVLAVLSWTPCGDGWSVDRLWKLYRGRAVPDADRTSPIYARARYACWVVIALSYTATGLSKVQDGGLYWWDPTNMRSMLYEDSLTPREFNWALSLHLAPAPDFLFALLGITAFLGELSFAVVLFSVTARRVLPFVAMMMHVGIFLLQRILFFDLILLQLVFFDFTRVRQALGRRLTATRGRIDVLYDGLCPFCIRTVRLLSSFDLFARVEFLDFRRLNLADYNRDHAVNLMPTDLEKEMYVVSRGRVYRGFYGYRVLALALPAFWPLAPWLFLPGVSSLGVWMYAFVARNRLSFIACDSHCATAPSEEGRSSTAAPADRSARHLGYALAVSAITVIALLCWFERLEFYPLTSWHLYSRLDTTGKITYLKILARYDSGETLPARLEDGIAALAFDARYGPALGKCVEHKEPKDLQICERFLTANASAYNKTARSGKRMTQYEIQEWSWDFRSDPSHPNYGNLTRRLIFDVGEGSSKTLDPAAR